MTKKLIIGLTGAFGAGKTTVAHMFEELGAFTIHADEIAHEALSKGSEPYKKVAALFPEAISTENERLDRKKIAAVIFKDSARRKKLEAVIHPYVHQRIWDEITDAEENIVLLDVPLLFESGFDKLCDKTIAVTAEDEEIAKRLREKGFSKEEIGARQNAQLSPAEKNKRANILIHNSESLEKTRLEVKTIWKDLKASLKGEK